MKMHNLTELRKATVPQLQTLLENASRVLVEKTTPAKPVVAKAATPKPTTKTEQTSKTQKKK